MATVPPVPPTKPAKKQRFDKVGTLPSNKSSLPDACGTQRFVVSCYSRFDNLAHGPRGTEAKKHCLYVYAFNASNGTMTLLSVNGSELTNPAFSRMHPTMPIMYTCTEDISVNGEVIAYRIYPNGEMKKIASVDAGGTSTCYITIGGEDNSKLIVANYWNSTLVSFPLDTATGVVGEAMAKYDPLQGKAMKASSKTGGHVNHSNNDAATIAERQADPHSHAIVLDPICGCIAYVPDLGCDLIRQFFFDKVAGTFLPLSEIKSGLGKGMPDGPRYMAFHKTYPVCYVINELSSNIAVFTVDYPMIQAIEARARDFGPTNLGEFVTANTMTMIQNIDTVPEAFPNSINTCGRICIHPSGRFVVVSNRGHDSLAIFKVNQLPPIPGTLRQVGFFHTRGTTPRHFQFDNSGLYLLVANQDSDNLAVFSFNLGSGELLFTGNQYACPSPNFVCNMAHVYPESAYPDCREVDTAAVAAKEAEKAAAADTAATNALPIEAQLAKALAEIKALKAAAAAAGSAL